MTANPGAITAAQLLVIQPGTRSSFRRRVLDAMMSLVPAAGGFFCFGTDDARAYADATRIVDGRPAPLVSQFVAQPASAAPTSTSESVVTSPGVMVSPGVVANTPPTKLTVAFGFDAKSVVSSPRRAYMALELYPEDERRRLPYFRDHSIDLGLTQALLVFLHEGGVLFGVAGLERRATERPFSLADCQLLEELAPFVITAARAQNAYDELTREATALRALGKMTGSLFVVDRDTRTVLWAANRQRGISWEEDVLPIEKVLVDAAEQMYTAKTKGEALPTPPALPVGTLVSVSRLEGEPVFRGARCLVVRVEPPKEANPQAMEGLSKREREIARLLIAGYSGVNVAAICGLSENTVRTYVRRLYTKLDVSNRADLVRALVAPGGAESGSPASALAPPPDSALVDGDETLD